MEEIGMKKNNEMPVRISVLVVIIGIATLIFGLSLAIVNHFSPLPSTYTSAKPAVVETNSSVAEEATVETSVVSVAPVVPETITFKVRPKLSLTPATNGSSRVSSNINK